MIRQADNTQRVTQTSRHSCSLFHVIFRRFSTSRCRNPEESHVRMKDQVASLSGQGSQRCKASKNRRYIFQVRSQDPRCRNIFVLGQIVKRHESRSYVRRNNQKQMIEISDQSLYFTFERHHGIKRQNYEVK